VNDRQLSPGRHSLWAAGLLLLALLLSQALGLWHGVVHGPVSTTSAAGAAKASAAGAAQRDATPHAGLSEQLLGRHGGHSDTAECRLYDQCSHGDALVQVPALFLPLVLTSFVLSVLAGLARARWHAHFQARGPPLVR